MHGIYNRYADTNHKRDAKVAEIEKSVKDYATFKGYNDVRFISGKLSQGEQQRQLRRILNLDNRVVSVFGFSRGGYSVYRELNATPAGIRKKLKEAIILGSPGTHNIIGVPTINHDYIKGVSHMNMVQYWTSHQIKEASH